VAAGKRTRNVKKYGAIRGRIATSIFPAMQEIQETRVQSLRWEDPLEEEMATHSSILA